MKISTILDHIDSGHMALPEFHRGYVWNRDQVRGLFDSLCRRRPVGGLLVWATESKGATHRGDGPLAAGVVKLLLDGQQRMTSLYGVVRGNPPKFLMAMRRRLPDCDSILKARHSSSIRDFLEARKALLASELNQRMEELLHGDTRWLAGPAAPVAVPMPVGGGISSAEEEAELKDLNDWVELQGLPRGTLAYDFSDAQTGEQKAVFDLAWPSGIQEELSQPVVVLLNEGAETITLASQAGFRCFTDPNSFRKYVETEVLAEVYRA